MKFGQGTSSFDALRSSRHSTSQACLNALEAILYTKVLLLSKITAGVVHLTFDHFGPCLSAISEAASIRGQR
jgi:hypothetical protein